MATGDLIKLGTLYSNGVKIARPSYPWRNGITAPQTHGAPATGDIVAYSSVKGNIVISDTDESDAYQMQWVEVYDAVNNKTLYIADRVCLVNIPWDDLNNQGLVFGKEYTIDGRKYLCRCMTGGEYPRGGASNNGGEPENNEWDRFIMNEDNLEGLPTPSDIEFTSLNANMPAVRTEPCNSLWNYWYMNTWMQETYRQNTTSRVVRGYGAVSRLTNSSATYIYDHIGFRPVLELLNSPPEKPAITSHESGQRVDTSLYVEFTTGTDSEDDTQTIQLQVADDEEFTSGVQTFSEVEKQNGDTWEAVTTITNDDDGSTFRIQASGLALNATKYIRVGSTDETGSNMTSWSDTVCVAVGDVLEIQTKPFQVDYQPSNIRVIDSKVIDDKASLQVYVCNNALDASPTWEEATDEYTSGSMHAFVNNQKTAENWAVAVKYVVKANDAAGEISISAIGVGVN